MVVGLSLPAMLLPALGKAKAKLYFVTAAPCRQTMRLCDIVWLDTNDPAAAKPGVIPTKALPAPVSNQRPCLGNASHFIKANSG